jgi:glyoxylase-like metal-dependent hydrolase (beta-lactamase superfamily II)
MQLKSFSFNPFQENTYLIWDELGMGAIIDPGCYTFEERQELKTFVAENKIQLQFILNTHAHIDHVLGVDFVKNEYKIPFCLHPKEIPILNDSENRASVYGFPHYQAASVDRWYTDNEIITIGNIELKVLFVPGHAPGHVAFYEEKHGLLIDGDVLFRRSVGRTDFQLCNHADLMQSISTELYTLPDSVKVYPGHGGPTTIGEEKVSNPYIKGV